MVHGSVSVRHIRSVTFSFYLLWNSANYAPSLHLDARPCEFRSEGKYFVKILLIFLFGILDHKNQSKNFHLILFFILECIGYLFIFGC